MTTEAATTTADAPKAEAEKPRPSLFAYSQWVHVGAGAEECEQRFTGKCQDDDHFHAWCRLANPFQVQDCMEKAAAAKARRVRMYRDPESDAHAILQDHLDSLSAAVEQAEANKPESAPDDWMNVPLRLLVDDIIDQDFQEDYSRAVAEVDAEEDTDGEAAEDGTPPKRWAHIDQDREEYDRQKELPEDQRADDYDALETTVAGYGRAIEAAMDSMQAPRREALMARPLDELLDIVRRHEVEKKAAEAYLQHFNLWQMYVCTYKPAGVKDGGKPVMPKQRYFPSIELLKFDTSTEVVRALQRTFGDLERNQARDRQGKES